MIKANYVKLIKLNGNSVKKRNCYILDYRKENGIDFLLNTNLSDCFNLIHLDYDLLKCPATVDGSRLVMDELAAIIHLSKNSLVIGHSFNGYVAFQLACLMPQIGYCIIIDARNFFREIKLTKVQTFKALLRNLYRQIVINRDIKYPISLLSGLYRRLTYKADQFEADFSSAMKCIIDAYHYTLSTNNMIYFKASRSSFRELDHGLSWNTYVGGKFHFRQIITDHNDMIPKHAKQVADEIIKITCVDSA